MMLYAVMPQSHWKVYASAFGSLLVGARLSQPPQSVAGPAATDEAGRSASDSAATAALDTRRVSSPRIFRWITVRSSSVGSSSNAGPWLRAGGTPLRAPPG